MPARFSHGSRIAELVSAMAAGWNAEFIVETWSQGGSRAEFVTAMKEAGMEPEVLVREPEEVMAGLVGIDFLVMDSKRKDFARVLRQARLSHRGAVLVCKNANSRNALCIVG
ncbi:PREDICTED: uncharacterized protein LOC103325785 [Prunus mume]|uniref:Uncharacterized protein LOC103325785 n=1 Tax=Prunus mume TaxID=102107 RepID=A0ABM1LLD3_PRUMU|nr:PREDICTED: uncharacterized protein LOC103325785 [Prunus mume]